jgi:DNA-binding MarR family transcriptional regulator
MGGVRVATPTASEQRKVDGERAQEEASERLRAAIGRLSRRLRPTVAGSGLSPSQISVLFTVVRVGPLGLSELAQVEGLNATMLSRITAQLSEQGLIVRSSDPGDRRSAIVTATAAGRRLRERIHRERTRALSEHVEALGEREREALWRALPVLEELAQRLPGGPAGPPVASVSHPRSDRAAARRGRSGGGR